MVDYFATIGALFITAAICGAGFAVGAWIVTRFLKFRVCDFRVQVNGRGWERVE